MANRIVIQADIDFYSSSFVGYSGNPMILGDVIINTPTGTSSLGDGKTKFFEASMATTFSASRFAPTIWIDGAALGTVYDFRLTNGGNGVEWVNSDENNFCKIRPIPNTQLKVSRNTLTNSGYTILLLDFKFVDLDFESDAYPGLRDGLGVHSVFHRGTYGLWLTSDTQLTTGHMMSANVVDGGHFKMKGIESEYGFSAIRFAGDDEDKRVSLTVENLYLHDGITGEGFYLGAAHGAPLAKIKNLNIKNVIIARRAAESLQLQHLITDLGVRANVENFVIFCGATDWVNAFQPYQDSGIQWSINTGNNYIQNGIIDGWASNGLVTYGSPETSIDGYPVTIQNCVFNQGGGIFLYINSSTTQGQKWIYKDIFLRDFTNIYFQQTGESFLDFYIGANNGIDKHKFLNITYDGVNKNNLFQNSSGYDILYTTLSASLPAITYVNSGWYEGAGRIKKWSDVWGGYFPNPSNTPVIWYSNDIAINAVDGLEYKFYKCKLDHSGSAALRPDLASGSYWDLLLWDQTGVRNDQVGWSSTGTQSLHPPDDFRLIADNYWNIKGMGLTCNQPNTGHTRYQWYRADNTNGTNQVEIPGGKSLIYTPLPCDRLKYLRLGVRVKDSNNNLGEWKYSSWQQVN